MIRFIFVVLFVVLFLILSTPLMLVEWIIGKFNPGLKDKSSLAIVNWAFRQVIRLAGTKVIAIGEENIPTDTVRGQSPQLFRCGPDLRPRSQTYRLRCEKRNAEMAPVKYLDEGSALSLPGPPGYQGRAENDPGCH